MWIAIFKMGTGLVSGDPFAGVLVGPGEHAPVGFGVAGKPRPTRSGALEAAIEYLQGELASERMREMRATGGA